MITYSIGLAAAKILSVEIDRAGMLVSSQWPCDTDSERCALGGDCIAFTIRVAAGHSGIVEIGMPGAGVAAGSTLVPLGADRPFLESELPPRPGANGAFSQSEAIYFNFAAGTLRWSADNLGGEVRLDERMPAVAIRLRLPADNDGEIVFEGSTQR